MAFLEEKHIGKIFGAYQKFESQEHFAVLKNIDEVLANKGNMAIKFMCSRQRIVTIPFYLLRKRLKTGRFQEEPLSRQ